MEILSTRTEPTDDISFEPVSPLAAIKIVLRIFMQVIGAETRFLKGGVTYFRFLSWVPVHIHFCVLPSVFS